MSEWGLEKISVIFTYFQVNIIQDRFLVSDGKIDNSFI